MTAFNVSNVNGKWIIGSDNETTKKNGLTDWNTLGSILNIPSVINGHKIDELGRYAFYNCQKIEEINIGDGIKQIGERCFSHCPNVRSIIIPPSVKFIGYCGIHCYNESAAKIYGTSSRESTGEGVIIITFLPESKISYIDNLGISRKENIIIYYFGRLKPLHKKDPVGKSSLTSIKIYAPFVTRFLGMKTLSYKLTSCQRRKNTSLLIFFIAIGFIS